MSRPVVAAKPSVTISLLDGYYTEQFVVNVKDSPKQWWQVFDRTRAVKCRRRSGALIRKKARSSSPAQLPGTVHGQFSRVPYLGGNLDV
ncbi:1,3-beta-galactosyl-N-acetylhexosamine phosphorylase N-terminal domain-containing protein [Ereboglobus luteus]|uniref:1,3-beta-galactosyl-N-acetylhexosamine phosphorylase N-terminal domain-containing protein n=1 Tax=Ereboglobus luteus TaxID=1796921 RepID=UPI00202B5018|nr:1,3-beta-galactosyl-N-acetylhexosamine phosphorylase N-terminal domain-containing protein [Ereboglobus luteus]